MLGKNQSRIPVSPSAPGGAGRFAVTGLSLEILGPSMHHVAENPNVPPVDSHAMPPMS